MGYLNPYHGEYYRCGYLLFIFAYQIILGFDSLPLYFYKHFQKNFVYDQESIQVRYNRTKNIVVKRNVGQYNHCFGMFGRYHFVEWLCTRITFFTYLFTSRKSLLYIIILWRFRRWMLLQIDDVWDSGRTNTHKVFWDYKVWGSKTVYCVLSRTRRWNISEQWRI